MNKKQKTYRIFQMLPGAGTIASSVQSSIWHNNLKLPLLDMGHDVISFDSNYDQFFVHAENTGWLKENRPKLSDRLLNAVLKTHEKKPLDFCFIYISDNYIEESVLTTIQNKGIPIINYSCNNIHQFHLIKNVSKQVSLNVFAERDAGEKFNSIGANAIQMQMAANPSVYKPYNIDYKHEVSFAGQRYADRGELSVYLIKNGIDLKLFGPRWDPEGEKVGNYKLTDKLDKLISVTKEKGIKYTLNYLTNFASKKNQDIEENKLLEGYVNGILSDEEMIKLFSESKINLGFSTVYQDGRTGGKQMAHLRLRDFEIPMSGGFYLTKYTDELEDYFKVGKEIETYSGNEELLEKCKFYLANDSSREKIGHAGLQRSLKDHTWQCRYNALFASKSFKELFNK